MAITQALQDLLDQSVFEDPAIHNGVLMVRTPDFVWAGASGFSDPEHKLPILAKDQFQIGLKEMQRSAER